MTAATSLPEYNFVANYTLSGNNLAVVGMGNLAYQLGNGELTLSPDATHTLSFVPYMPTASNTISVTGTVTMTAGTFVAPRVALIFLSRSMGFVNDPRDDKPLTFSGNTASFDLSRTGGALGTDRITFGTTAGISIGMVIVYDDIDQSGTLDIDSLTEMCANPAHDCVRGVAALILGYRDGSSSELQESPYQYLQPGLDRIAHRHRHADDDPAGARVDRWNDDLAVRCHGRRGRSDGSSL